MFEREPLGGPSSGESCFSPPEDASTSVTIVLKVRAKRTTSGHTLCWPAQGQLAALLFISTYIPP